MSTTKALFKGWNIVFPEETSSRRSSRRTQVGQISLKRDLDGAEISLGDHLLVQTESGVLPVLVKEIYMGTSDYVEVLCFRYLKWNNINPQQYMDKYGIQGEYDAVANKNEIYITAEVVKVYVKDYVDHCKVLSEDQFKEILIDDSNRDSVFLTRNGCSNLGEELIDANIEEIITRVKSGQSADILQWLKENTLKSPKKNASPKKQTLLPQSGSPRKRKVVYEAPSESDSDEEFMEESDDELKFVTIKKQRKPKSISQLTKTLRGARGKYKSRVSTLTPAMDEPAARLPSTMTSKPMEIPETIFTEMKSKLHTSSKLNSLPAREDEFASLYLTLQSAIESQQGTCIYVSGTPGVGKTVTVREVIKALHSAAGDGEIPEFQYLEINGLKIVSPTMAYENLWSKISGEKLSPAAAVNQLETYFKSASFGGKKPVVVLMDELDTIVTKNQNVMYNFFNWPTYEHSKLIVIAVANTMDLPERVLSNKISSRLGLTRMLFAGYTHDELKDIIQLRLEGMNGSYFDVDRATGFALPATGDAPGDKQRVRLRISKDAIEIAARKVASVSGDARRALKICKRAVEIAEQEYLDEHGFSTYKHVDRVGSVEPESADEVVHSVQIAHIMKAIAETIASPLSVHLQGLPFASKLFLYSMLSLIRKSGIVEHTLGDVIDEIRLTVDMNHENFKEMALLLHDTSLRMHGWEHTLRSLSESGIVVSSASKTERMSNIKFNVATEEVSRIIESFI